MESKGTWLQKGRRLLSAIQTCTSRGFTTKSTIRASHTATDKLESKLQLDVLLPNFCVPCAAIYSRIAQLRACLPASVCSPSDRGIYLYSRHLLVDPVRTRWSHPAHGMTHDEPTINAMPLPNGGGTGRRLRVEIDLQAARTLVYNTEQGSNHEEATRQCSEPVVISSDAGHHRVRMTRGTPPSSVLARVEPKYSACSKGKCT
jgi:hypothetical protein